MKYPIVEEVRKAQQDHAREFNYDLSVIWIDLKNRKGILTCCIFRTDVKVKV